MPTPKLIYSALLLAFVSATSQAAPAQQTPNPRYPLRLHVLAIDDTYRTARLQPNWCSGSIPNLGGDPGASGGTESSPCGSGSATLSFGDNDGFSGAGRADLVSPPNSTQALSNTQALNFTYDGCGRVRVAPGFQGLAARWKKPGKLEVLIPSDSIKTGNIPTRSCTLTVSTHEFIYLRMRDGSILKVSQEAYLRKPALRAFLSGGPETLQQRTPPPTVSVKQLRSPE